MGVVSQLIAAALLLLPLHSECKVLLICRAFKEKGRFERCDAYICTRNMLLADILAILPHLMTPPRRAIGAAGSGALLSPLNREV